MTKVSEERVKKVWVLFGSKMIAYVPYWKCLAHNIYRHVAEIQIFEKTYLIVIKDETGLKFKINDSTLFLIGSYVQKVVASY